MAEPVEFNPYATPKTISSDVVLADVIRTATREARIGSFLIDLGLLLALQVAVNVFLYPIWRSILQMLQVDPFASFDSLMPPTWLATALTLAAFLLVNAYAFRRHQTLGQLLLRLRVVRTDESPAPVWRVLLLRILPVFGLLLIPTIGAFLFLVCVLPILGGKQRGLHDWWSATQVVRY